MMISSVGPSLFPQTSALVANLKANGLSVDKAALVATDAKAAVAQVGSVKRGPEGKAALRDALKERINADVTAGKLSADDANAIFQTFAQMDPANQNGGQTSGGQGGAPGGGAGQQAPQDDDATTVRVTKFPAIPWRRRRLLQQNGPERNHHRQRRFGDDHHTLYGRHLRDENAGGHLRHNERHL